MPEGVASVVADEGLLDHLTLTAKPGVIGGQPASGRDFGAAVNCDAVIPQNNQFEFYDDGGLDIACLGLAQADAMGSVNVSRCGTRVAGAGGFINISQNARSAVFAGAFTALGLDVAITDGSVGIKSEDVARKFLPEVEQITFPGARAARLGQPVLYVTERCMFELTEDRLRLAEIAPGIDIEPGILALMQFQPILEDVAQVDGRIFVDKKMGLRIDLLHLDLRMRVALDVSKDTLFLNFEKMRIRSMEDVELVKRAVEAVCASHPSKGDVIVNHDDCRIGDDVVADWAVMVAALHEQYYLDVS